MNKRIQEAFAHGKAFIPFITAGDPDEDLTEKLVPHGGGGSRSDRAGDTVFRSVAEVRRSSGPIRGPFRRVTTDRLFELVRRIRKKDRCAPGVSQLRQSDIYLWAGALFAVCQDTGVDGVILPDVPFEEKEEIFFFFATLQFRLWGVGLHFPHRAHLHERIRTIAREAEGFVYCVSSLGVAGVREHITTDVGEMVSLVKKGKGHSLRSGFRSLRRNRRRNGPRL